MAFDTKTLRLVVEANGTVKATLTALPTVGKQ
jgi:hypothetical protein